jgi:hypothetical protein
MAKTIIVNGDVLEQAAVVQDNMLMFPFRAVAEALGGTAADSLITVRDMMNYFVMDVTWCFQSLSIIITG